MMVRFSGSCVSLDLPMGYRWLRPVGWSVAFHVLQMEGFSNRVIVPVGTGGGNVRS